MTRALMVAVLVGVAAVAAAVERPLLRGREAPRATDLLRAERLSEQAKKRLKTPRHRGPGWRKGGSGWNAPDVAAPAPDGQQPSSVIINVQPPRRQPKVP